MLFAIGIRHVGETVAKKIARSVGSMERLVDLDQQALVGMEEVGPVIAE
ncbi:MAG TPA: helix-hairpin-helix domain-containing protein, partial [Flavobacteriales bacterium]|nr:helix-hairpin-helix domain-containing protein [Flavobacteriales bacterium]